MTSIFKVKQILALWNIERLLTQILGTRRFSLVYIYTRLQQRRSRQLRQCLLFGKGISDMTSFPQAAISLAIIKAPLYPLHTHIVRKSPDANLCQDTPS